MSSQKRDPVNELSEVVDGYSVALVGNSERILRDAPGELIDRHDVVIRMNCGLPSCIGDAAGTRTTIWAAARHWESVETPDDCEAILWMKLTKMGEHELERWVTRHTPKIPMFTWTQELEDECREYVGADPGTGIRMLWWLRKKVDPKSVSCYGMDCWEEPTHWSGMMNTPNHSPKLEREAMLRLL